MRRLSTLCESDRKVEMWWGTSQVKATVVPQDLTATEKGTRLLIACDTCNNAILFADYKKKILDVQLPRSSKKIRKKCVSIPITNDKLNEDDEKFKVVLSVVNAPAVKGIIPGVAVVTIIDDDGKFVCV